MDQYTCNNINCPSSAAHGTSVCCESTPSGSCGEKPVDPETASCGSAAKTYGWEETAFDGALCSAGTTTTPSFPDRGKSVSWTCTIGASTASCSAARDGCPAGTEDDGNTCRILEPMAGYQCQTNGTRRSLTSCGGGINYNACNIYEYPNTVCLLVASGAPDDSSCKDPTISCGGDFGSCE